MTSRSSLHKEGALSSREGEQELERDLTRDVERAASPAVGVTSGVEQALGDGQLPPG